VFNNYSFIIKFTFFIKKKKNRNIIDTAYLFTLENSPNASPSLRDISDQVLAIKLPETHDSIQDSKVALYAATKILIDGAQKNIIRSVTVNKNQLLVHRIPEFCSEENIRQMIISYTQIIPTKINFLFRNNALDNNNSKNNTTNPNGKAVVWFGSQQHCDLAFDTIAGPDRPDKQNKSQKRIYLKGGGYVLIRKM
jgi:hypothetical protein